MRVLTRGSRRKPATDERTGSVEAPLPSGYSRHHEEAGSRDEVAAAPGSGQALDLWEIWCEKWEIWCEKWEIWCEKWEIWCGLWEIRCI